MLAYKCYGPRAESHRLPKEASKREALVVQIGADGDALMDAIDSRDDAHHLRPLPDVEVLRRLKTSPGGVDACRSVASGLAV